MSGPNTTIDQNLLPVQAYFNLDGTFQTFIGQGRPFTVTISGPQSGLAITNSTLDSSPIGATTPSTGVFTNITTTTGTITTSPVSSTDIANKYYVDSVAQGLGPKAACQVGTTANISLTGLQTIDGYTTLAGDRVLVKNQTTTSQNGIYIASATAWTRATDLDVWSEVPGAYTVVLNGGQAETGWVSTAATTGTINVTAMPWVQFSGNSTYYAGTGLTLSSNTFSITNTGVTAASYGSASQNVTFVINAQGQVTSATSQNIAIAASQITSGTISSFLITGNYSGITGVGTITTGTWNGTTIGVAYGGTGATTFTSGYLKANGTSAFSTVSTIPNTDVSGLGTMSTQNANSVAITGGTISGLSSPLAVASGGSGASTLTGYVYGNGTSAFTASTTIPNSAITGLGTMSTQNANNVAITGGTESAVSHSGDTISDYLKFTPQSSLPSYARGEVFYDSNQDSLAYYNGVTNNELHIGQEIQLKVYNNSGSTINVGQPVYITSTSSGFVYPTVALAIANSLTTANVIGLANQAIPTGTAGYVTTIGVVSGVNTGTYTVGDTLYLSPYSAGFYQNTIPPTGYAVKIGTVSYVNSSGQIYVNKSNLSVQAGNIVGQVSLSNGGTSANLTAVAGGVVYSGASALAISAAGTSGQVLSSNGTGVPTWVTPVAYATVTDDTTANAVRYPLFANQTAGNLTTEYTSSTKYQFNPSTGILTATGFSGSGASLTSLNASNISSGTLGIGFGGTGLTTTPTNGQLLIGNGTGYTLSTITAGSNITVTNASGSITIASTATGGSSTVSDDTTTNATRYPLFANQTSGTATTIYTSSTKYQYNPSTGELDSPEMYCSNGIHSNSNTVSSSYTIPANSNALSLAPLNLAASVSVTIPSSSTWRLI
jgi:hypothetical protein